jgi:hypothetical protein
MSKSGYTFLFEAEDGTLRKITKIQPYSAGGFAVLMPYHRERRGYLAKHRVDYSRREDEMLRQDVIEYSAEDRVKLSIHQDGFVQFSGEQAGKITSGRDPQTGEAKGLGLFTQPLSNPIRTGPTFSITVWGLEDFNESSAPATANTVVFNDDDFYLPDGEPSGVSPYQLEVFTFPQEFWGGVRRSDGKLSLSLCHPHFSVPGVVHEFRVVPLPGQRVFLGCLPSRVNRIITESPSGFVLNGPSEFRVADALIAIYPSPWSRPPEEDLGYAPPSELRDDEQQKDTGSIHS